MDAAPIVRLPENITDRTMANEQIYFYQPLKRAIYLLGYVLNHDTR